MLISFYCYCKMLCPSVGFILICFLNNKLREYLIMNKLNKDIIMWDVTICLKIFMYNYGSNSLPLWIIFYSAVIIFYLKSLEILYDSVYRISNYLIREVFIGPGRKCFFFNKENWISIDKATYSLIPRDQLFCHRMLRFSAEVILELYFHLQYS